MRWKPLLMVALTSVPCFAAALPAQAQLWYASEDVVDYRKVSDRRPAKADVVVPTGPQKTGMILDLAIASAAGNMWKVKNLVEQGANINERDQEGYTALTWAAQHGQARVVEYLAGRNAQLNSTDLRGYTPLMWAAQEGHAEVVSILVAKGANPDVKNRKGNTALSLAYYAGKLRVLPLLREASERYNGRFAIRPAASPPPSVATPMLPPLTGTMLPMPSPRPEANIIQKFFAYKKLGEVATAFGSDFQVYLQENAKAGLDINSLNALGAPETKTGKSLSYLFANMAQSRDFQQCRIDLVGARATLEGNDASRFAKYVNNTDVVLTEIGY